MYREVVIKLSEEDYNRIKEIPDAFDSLTSRIYKAIKDGKLLPPKHAVSEPIELETIECEEELDFVQPHKKIDLDMIFLSEKVKDKIEECAIEEGLVKDELSLSSKEIMHLIRTALMIDRDTRVTQGGIGK